MMKNAIILCSGGLDSVTLAYHLVSTLKDVNTSLLFFNYGQKQLKQEQKSVRFFASSLNLPLREIKIASLPELAITNLPKDASKDLKDTRAESAHWYIPFRNGIFLAYALSIAEKLSLQEKAQVAIFTGFKNEGKEPFVDATKAFVNSYNHLAQESTKTKPKVYAPFIDKDKEDIIQLATKLAVPLEETYSCYLGSSKHCGECLACRARKAGFHWANIQDPTEYLN